MIRYAFAETWSDFPDPNNSSLTIYLTGCSFNCEDCHNDHLKVHNSDHFSLSDAPDVKSLLMNALCMMERIKTKNVVILGGEPFFNGENIHITKYLSKELIDRGNRVMIYTGHTVDFVRSMSLSFTFLKCGLYDKTRPQKPKLTSNSLTLGSSNQKIYDSEFNLVSENGVFTFK